MKLLKLFITSIIFIMLISQYGFSFDKGIKLGISLSKWREIKDNVITNNPPIPTMKHTYKSGVAVGGYFTVNISNRISLQPELLYITKDNSYEGGSEIFTFMINYLELPILVKYSFINSVNNPTVYLGPSISFLLNSKFHHQIIYRNIEYGSDLYNIRNYDLGFIFGLDIKIPLGSNKIILDGRYNLGLKKISESSAIYDQHDDIIDFDLDSKTFGLKSGLDLRNSCFIFSLGFSF